MSHAPLSITILLADDDADDRMMAREALEESRLTNALVTVDDGEELLEYLSYRGRYEGVTHKRPGLILLDLNMPRTADSKLCTTRTEHCRLTASSRSS